MKGERYYVTMTDKFLSNWGKAAGKISKIVILCDSREEAEIVFDNGKARSDMKDLALTNKKPSYLRTWTLSGEPKGDFMFETGMYHVAIWDKSTVPNWFEPGWFRKKEVPHGQP